jgi:hypothetical protein
MHNSLRLYSRYREQFLRYYIFQAKWTKIPLLGRLVTKVANIYAQKGSSAYLLTLAEANELVDNSAGVALGPCACRAVFRNCANPIETEIMVGLRRNVFITGRPHDYGEITKQEAKDILSECHHNGLIHTIVKCHQDFYAICNCCSCCCVPMRLRNEYGIGGALSRRDDIVQEFKTRRLLEEG